MPMTPVKSSGSKTEKETLINFNGKESEPVFDFEELILSDKVKNALKSIISAPKCWDTVFEKWNFKSAPGQKNKKSILANFYGKPGTGKTMAAHAVAKCLNRKILVVNYAELESKFVGETSKNIVSLFEYAKTKVGTNEEFVIFFDEADAFLSKRVTSMTGANDVAVNQTRSVLLQLLNDYSGVVLFATNFISNYDNAFMRRIHYQIEFSLPDEKCRVELWKRYIPNEMPTDLDILEIAKKYDSISPSNISTAVLQSALRAAENKLESVPKEYFEESIEAILKANNENLKPNQNSKIISSKVEEISENEVPNDVSEKIKNMEDKLC